MPSRVARIILAHISIFVVIALAGCQTQAPSSGEFAIYLLDGVRSADLAQAEIEILPLQDQPLLSAEDIVTYTQETHELELSTTAYTRIQQLFSLPVKTDGLPFAVTVGGKPIYVGAFWTPLSSLSFDGVVILQPFSQDGTRIRIELGYPGPDAFSGKDPRADAQVMAALRVADKLR